ncbi:hypothetical protein BH10PSE12_BH10PSE12_03050 [soil metagenome]
MVHCTKCGQAAREGDSFCAGCGNRLAAPAPSAQELAVPETASPSPDVEQSEEPTSFKPLVVVLSIVAVMGTLAFVASRNETSAPSLEGKAETSKSAEIDADNAMNAAMAAAGAAPSDSPQENWFYATNTDDVRGGKIYTANQTSNNSIQLDFPYAGGSTLGVTVRKHPAHGTDVYFTLSQGQLLCNSYSDCHATVRFDKGPARRFNLNEASDNSNDLVFVSNSGAFISALKASERMIVELEIYQSGRPQFSFDTAGLKWPPAPR